MGRKNRVMGYVYSVIDHFVTMEMFQPVVLEYGNVWTNGTCNWVVLQWKPTEH